VGPLAKRILILGMNSFDSGKTVLAQTLAERLLESGLSVEYFKPLSGHNYWYRYEHTERCIADSILASWDAYQVRQAIKSKVPLETANPIHSLYVPSILRHPSDITSSHLFLGGWDSVLTMQRFSRPSEAGAGSVSLIANNLVNSGSIMITPEEVDHLSSGTEVVPIEDGVDFERYSNTHLESILSESLALLEMDTDISIIEGFNDSVLPWEGLDRVDSVVVTGPGHLFTYNPERFRKAAFLGKYSSQPIREVPFSRVSDMITPDETIHLKPHQGISSEQIRGLDLMGKE